MRSSWIYGTHPYGGNYYTVLGDWVCFCTKSSSSNFRPVSTVRRRLRRSERIRHQPRGHQLRPCDSKRWRDLGARIQLGNCTERVAATRTVSIGDATWRMVRLLSAVSRPHCALQAVWATCPSARLLRDLDAVRQRRRLPAGLNRDRCRLIAALHACAQFLLRGFDGMLFIAAVSTLAPQYWNL